MADFRSSIPEPLQSFHGAAPPLATRLLDIDRQAALLREHRATGRLLPNTVESLRIELTYHSNAIEGSTLSLRETQLIIEGKSPASERPLREIYEARNHDRALRAVEQWAAAPIAADGPIAPLRQSDILAVHAMVLADIDSSAAGRFRSDRVRIAGTGFIPPGPQKFDQLILHMLGMVNDQTLHPALAAAELHYNLVSIHPFADGNGRTARLMMNYHLLRYGYPFAIIQVNERGRYLGALDEANHGNVEAFAGVVVDALSRILEALLAA